MTLLERLAIAGAALCDMPEATLNAALKEHDLNPVNPRTYVDNKRLAGDYRGEPKFMLKQMEHPESFGKMAKNKP